MRQVVKKVNPRQFSRKLKISLFINDCVVCVKSKNCEIIVDERLMSIVAFMQKKDVANEEINRKI